MPWFTGRSLPAIAMIAMLALGFGLLAYASAVTKCATGDEPLHAVSAFVRLHEFDFRCDPEDPPLFGYWAMIPQPADALRINRTSPAWHEMITYPWRQGRFIEPALYKTPGVDPDKFFNRSRAMMTLIGVALAGIVAWWAWELGGRWAALIATVLYCFDPTFLGHAPLVKNDVPLAMVMAALVFAIYRGGQRMTLVRAAAIALLIAAALTVKFSGVIVVFIACVLLLWRGFLNRPWLVLGRLLVSGGKKVSASLGVIALSAMMSYAGIWACYGFRYAPTPDPQVRLNVPLIVRAGVRAQLMVRNNSDDEPGAAELDARVANPPLVARTLVWVDDHELLPQAWTVGLLDTWATTQRRFTFLFEQYSTTGWWYYFPLAMLFKTPLGTLAVIALATALVIRGRIVRRPRSFDRWAIICVSVPVAIYLLWAMGSNLNIGVRHMLPLYPLIYIATGAALAHARKSVPRFVAGSVLILLGGLVVETLGSTPHFIAFFNAASGGSRGGLHLLGDSNLDWGQDLPLLRDWMQRHPKVAVRIIYFGGVDQTYYVVGHPFKLEDLRAPATQPDDPVEGPLNVLAISATTLQGTYPPIAMRPVYEVIRRSRPLDVLGGTIYIYPLPLRD